MGRYIEAKLGEHDKKGKPKHTLAQLLAADQGKSETDKTRFRSMSGMVTRTVRVDASGIWEDEEPSAEMEPETPEAKQGAGE